MSSKIYATLAALALSSAISAQAVAGSCTVPFLISTGELTPDLGWQIQCTGPWARTSKCVALESNLDKHQFYCAEETTFSMYGEWLCTSYDADGANCLQDPRSSTGACIKKGDPNPLTITGFDNDFGSFDTNAPESCEKAQTTSFLGLTNTEKPDRDTFAFDGMEDELITLTLEKDLSGGNTGDLARLQVKGERGPVLGEEAGALPLSVDVLLPETATYEIVVREVKKGKPTTDDEPFRGHYLLTVEPEGGADDLLIEPQRDVEP